MEDDSPDGSRTDDPDPLGPHGITSAEDLARRLTSLRTSAEVPLRSLAGSLGVPPSTLSGWLTGTHVPHPRQLDIFRALLGCLGVEDDGEIDQWVAALLRVRRPPGPRPTDPRPG